MLLRLKWLLSKHDAGVHQAIMSAAEYFVGKDKNEKTVRPVK